MPIFLTDFFVLASSYSDPVSLSLCSSMGSGYANFIVELNLQCVGGLSSVYGQRTNFIV